MRLITLLQMIPTADEIFEADKFPSRVWALLKLIFDTFAMAEPQKQLSLVLKWVSMSLQFFGSQMKPLADFFTFLCNRSSQPNLGDQQRTALVADLVAGLHDGMVYMCIFKLFADDQAFQLDSKMMF